MSKIEKPIFQNIESSDIDWALSYYRETFFEIPTFSAESFIERILDKVVQTAASKYSEFARHSKNKTINRISLIKDYLEAEMPDVCVKAVNDCHLELTLKCGLKFEFNYYNYHEVRCVRPVAEAYVTCGTLLWQKRQSMITFFNFLEDNYPAWYAELQRYAMELSKERMMTKIQRTAIDSIVLQKLRDEGFEFFITPMKANDKITVKISKSQKTTFYLPHKTFTDKIDKVIAVIKEIKEFAD